MALTATQRNQCIRALVAFDQPAPFNFSKTDMQAAVDAVDAWATANSAAYNTALPAVFRNGATANEKAFLLAAVCACRAGLIPPGGA